MQIMSTNSILVNRILWKLKLSNTEINFKNALIIAQEQIDVYPARLAGMTIMWFKNLERDNEKEQ
jgi:hypothetical protein